MGRKSRRGGQRAAAAKKKVGRIKKKVRTVAPKKKAPEPKAVAPRDFVSDFDAAFDKLDKQKGNRNYLFISDVRKEMPQYTEEQFNKKMIELIKSRRYGAEATEGSMVKITDAQKAGGIPNGPDYRERLIYVRKRDRQ